MAKIFLITLSNPEQYKEWTRKPYNLLRESSEKDIHHKHQRVESADEADIILFAELHEQAIHPFLRNILRHPLYRQYPNKCYLFCSTDYPIALLPGIYCSIEKRYYNPARARSGPYLTEQNPLIAFYPFEPEAKYLFSFMGSVVTHPIRREILAQLSSHPRGYLLDNSKKQFVVLHEKKEELDDYFNNYIDVIRQSKFVLCPRGAGAGSIRLFETMKMGRCPVIIADDWVEPEGPAWDTFSIRVAERDIARIPEILAAHENEAVTRGKIAREEWEKYFSPETLFHYFAEQCVAMQQQQQVPQSVAYWLNLWQRLRIIHLRKQWWQIKARLKS